MGASVLAFGVAAAAMVVLMFVVSFVVAGAQERVVSTLRARTHDVKRWGGRLLLAAGAWLIVIGVWPSVASGILPG